jgi:hypothetical protein
MSAAARYRRAIGVPLVAAALLALAPAPAAAANQALLQGLNKITARVSPIEAPADRAVTFGTLSITMRTCWKAPPEEPPESAVFLEIDDVKLGEDAVRLFTGWMFASSPALSALEHPVYDVWVLDCREVEGPGDVPPAIAPETIPEVDTPIPIPPPEPSTSG